MRNPPSLDTWTIIFLFAACQGIIFSGLLYFRGSSAKRNQKFYLLLIMILFCLMILEYVLWWTGYLVYMPHMMDITGSFTFLFGPFLYFYFRQIFRNTQASWPQDLIHYLPALLYIALHLTEYGMDALTKTQYITGSLKKPTGIPWPWLNILQLSLYTIICYYEYRDEAENTIDVKKWFRLILILFSGYICSIISYYTLVRLPWFNSTWDYMISASMMIFIYSIALYGYYHDKVFNGFELTENQATKPKYQNSALKEDHGKKILDRLHRLMDLEKLYVDDEINLDKLAARLEISRHQLSQALNEHAQMNFFEYINSKRIEEAKQLLKNSSKKELNIIEIAYRVGYSNKVTFNNTFKKYTGQTPSEFRASPASADSNIVPIQGHQKLG